MTFTEGVGSTNGLAQFGLDIVSFKFSSLVGCCGFGVRRFPNSETDSQAASVSCYT